MSSQPCYAGVACVIPSISGDVDNLLMVTYAAFNQTTAPQQVIIFDVSERGLRAASDLRFERWLAYSRAEVIRGQPLMSSCAARRAALAYTQAANIWFLDDDAVPRHDCLMRLLHAGSLIASGSKIEITRVAPWGAHDANFMATNRPWETRLPWADTANLLIDRPLLERAFAAMEGWEDEGRCSGDIVLTALAVAAAKQDACGIAAAIAYHLPKGEARWQHIEDDDAAALAFLLPLLPPSHYERLAAAMGRA